MFTGFEGENKQGGVKVRKYVLLSLLLVTPTGFLFKFYSGPLQWWFNDYGAGVLYVIFWILVVFHNFTY